MREGRRGALLVVGGLDEEIVESAISASREAPFDERVRAGLEAVVEIAETDPTAIRSALCGLRGDHMMLGRLEGCLQVDASRATFALGAALQLALTELALPEPDLRARVPELERWLKGSW
jgi:hypothetical protein